MAFFRPYVDRVEGHRPSVCPPLLIDSSSANNSEVHDDEVADDESWTESSEGHSDMPDIQRMVASQDPGKAGSANFSNKSPSETHSNIPTCPSAKKESSQKVKWL